MSIDRRYPHRPGRKRNSPRLAYPSSNPRYGNQRLRPDDDSDTRWAITDDNALNHGHRSRQLDTFDNAVEPAIWGSHSASGRR